MSEDTKSFLFPEIVPESTKEELLNPSASLVGQAMRGVLHWIFDPLVKINIVKDQELKDFQHKINSKNDNIPVENRDDSKLNLALKAIDDSKFQLNSEELRAMFANLISSTFDSTKNQYIQPSFSSILRDLSPEDARILNIFTTSRHVFPSVDITFHDTNSSVATTILENILLTGDDTINNPIAITSLERLGLITIRDEVLSSQTNKILYETIKTSDVYNLHLNMLPVTLEGFTFTEIRIAKKQMYLTTLGLKLIQVVT